MSFRTVSLISKIVSPSPIFGSILFVNVAGCGLNTILLGIFPNEFSSFPRSYADAVFGVSFAVN